MQIDFEQSRLVPKAELAITSGKVTIIDPGYTLEHYSLFEHDFLRKLREPTFLRLLRQPTSTDDISIIQHPKAVYLGNFGGDGNYAIYRTASGLELILSDQSEEDEDKPIRLGSVWVDYKMIMLADSSIVTSKDFPPDSDSYPLDSGKYRVSFDKDSKIVEVKKLPII